MGSTLRLLIAEDDKDDQLLLREALEDAGRVEFEFVSDGLELLERLRGTDRPPSLVMVDLNMPRMSGHELLSILRTDPELKHLPVVVLTTSTSQDDVSRAYEAGASTYLTKPSTFDELTDLMGKLIDYWSRARLASSS